MRPLFLYKSEKNTDEGHLKQMREGLRNIFYLALLKILFLISQPKHMLYKDFAWSELVPNIGPFPIKILKYVQKLLKMVYIIPNFLVLHFGENFMKIQTKIAKLRMHESLH